MFDQTSRYYHLKPTIFVTPSGRQIIYKRRRMLPQGEELPLLAEVTVTPGDRLDLIAAQALGNPELFWRICDANDAMDPFDLATPGKILRVAMPQATNQA